MIPITDGKQNRSRTNANLCQAAFKRSRLAGLSLGVAAIALSQAIALGAEARPGGPSEGVASLPTPSSMTVAIRQSGATSQQIALSVGRSAILELSEPVKRVQTATAEIAEVKVLSPRQVLITGKAVGRTQVLLWDEREGQLIVSVLVQLDLAELQAAIAQIAPGADVQARAIQETVVLSGSVPDVDSATRIEEIARAFSPKMQNLMKVAGMHQVMLRCTVAEVNKRAIRQLGINGWMAGDNLRDIFAVNQIAGINPVNIGGQVAVPNIIQDGGIPFITDRSVGLPLTPRPQLSIGFPRVQMQLFFQAMRENDLLRVLAEPNLVALSGQEASFLAGGEFPIPVPQGAYGTVTIEYRQYGVRLKFTPTVIGRQMVRLKVTPEVSEQDFTNAIQLGGYVVPGLRSRTATTMIELASGSTIAIAGLLSEQTRGISQKVPGLGDVPALGALFSSVDYQKNLTELVILVTPELVDGMQPDQVPPVPGQFMTDPNDWELFGLGMVEGQPAPDTSDDSAALEMGYAPKYRKVRSSPEQMSLHGPWGPADPVEAVQ